jgi:hypothetical protein
MGSSSGVASSFFSQVVRITVGRSFRFFKTKKCLSPGSSRRGPSAILETNIADFLFKFQDSNSSRRCVMTIVVARKYAASPIRQNQTLHLSRNFRLTLGVQSLSHTQARRPSPPSLESPRRRRSARHSSAWQHHSASARALVACGGWNLKAGDLMHIHASIKKLSSTYHFAEHGSTA